MKPTKEQLADPKWWNRNTESTDNYVLWSKERLSLILLENYINDIDGYELLAKRPEPAKEQYVPEVGVECEYYTGESYRKGEVLKIDKNGLFHIYAMVDSETNMLCWSADLRPIKTQREEFIEKCISGISGVTNPTTEAIRKDMAAQLYDAGCRFDLTKKDGE